MPTTEATGGAPADPPDASLTAIERLLRRDRVVVAVALALLATLGWASLVWMAQSMDGMDMGAEMAMPQMQAWTAMDLALLFVMWAVMMVAMMVPSAAPLVLTVASVNRKRRKRHDPLVPTGLFLVGYLLVWTAFSIVATVAQWGLHTTALLSPQMVSASPVLGGLLLVGAGIFQFTSLKDTCLAQCRSPLGFVMSRWRNGPIGAVRMGLEHGSYCVGCCWVLMALLFVAGVMNLLWVAAISLFVLAEKMVPKGEIVSRVAGVALLVVGAGLLLTAL